MILPFVRELVADLESSPLRLSVCAAIWRAARDGDVCPGSPRRRARCTCRTWCGQPVGGQASPALVLVSDNKAAEALYTAVMAACDLTGALDCDEVLRLPAHDVLAV